MENLNPLSPRTLVAGYAAGVFPMPDPDDESQLLWFAPDPRGLLPLDERFHVPRRLAATVRAGRYVCTVDRDFAGVMRACADREEDTWITDDFHRAYGRLHELGLAHSVEAWRPNVPESTSARPARKRRSRTVAPDPPATPDFAAALAGGVYGVSLGGAFFAESMFHRDTDAGKVALVYLIEHLRARGFVLCDVQWLTPHLARFGGIELPRLDYLSVLAEALAKKARF